MTASRRCRCGCGQAVRASFVPGHNRRLSPAIAPRLSPAEHADVRRRHASGERLKDIAAVYNISLTSAWRARHRDD